MMSEESGRYVVLLGPPGVGKGTQAEILSEKIHLPHISSGDLFRDHISSRTELGVKAQTYMDRGELVPDNLTIAMIRDRLAKADCERGAILDGFPRTPAQADALHEILGERRADVSIVPFLTAAPQVLIERASGRWTCRADGHVYHQVFSPPKVAGKCDIDGSPLYQREDDKAETVARRIRVYLEQTAPLVDYYRARHKLVEIDGTQSIDKVTDGLLSAIGTQA
jgi:adenylate kinase